MLYFVKLLGTLALANSFTVSLAFPSSLFKREPTCSNITFPVSISFNNYNLPTFTNQSLAAWLEAATLAAFFVQHQLVPIWLRPVTANLKSTLQADTIPCNSLYMDWLILVTVGIYNSYHHCGSILNLDQTGAVMAPLALGTIVTVTVGSHMHPNKGIQHYPLIVLVMDCPTIQILSSSFNPLPKLPPCTKSSRWFEMAHSLFLVLLQRSYTLAIAMAPVLRMRLMHSTRMMSTQPFLLDSPPPSVRTSLAFS